VRRAVEDDDGFRERVAEVATEELVGRPGWLWLVRPEGWDAELAELADQEAEAETATAQADAERSAAKRLDVAEAEARRATAELAVARGELRQLRTRYDAAVAEEPRLRRRADELERALEKVKVKAERAQAELVDVHAAREAAEARAASLAAEVAALRTAIDELSARADAGAAPSLPALPREAVEGLRQAVTVTAALSEVLGRVADALDTEDVADDHASGTGSARPRKANGVRLASARRRALRLPRGLTEESIEGASYLLVESGAPVLVDGYNVAMLGWPGEPLPEQRTRLLDTLDDLASRAGTSIQVVFDGAEVGPAPPAKNRQVRVQFSPPGVIADDELRRLVAGMSSERPVVVATNDRSLADDLRRMGANVVRSEQLLAVARR
jgi:hypothetical protein